MNSTLLRQTRLGSALVLAGMLCTFGSLEAQAKKKAKSVSDLVPTIENIQVVQGAEGLELWASGTATLKVDGQKVTSPFTAPVDIRLADPRPVNGLTVSQVGACPILDLELGPIYLDLLGLIVETHPICLQITAYEGGGLLGDLLCTVANLLEGGLSLDQILAGNGLVDGVTGATLIPGLKQNQINKLLKGLTNLFNQALRQLVGAILRGIFPGIGTCDILHLELGPLELTLLGLEVILDDCEGGPVVVDITGDRSGLLGALLCGLLGGGLLDIGSTTLQDILDAIGAVLNP